jgi:hypothetical protein
MKKPSEYISFKWFMGFGIFVLPFYASATVIISEIAWMGTAKSTSDEWIELANTGGDVVDLTGWTLEASDGTPKIALSGSISAGGFFLLERTGDDTVPNVPADQIYTGALGNSGETLVLKDSGGSAVDTVDASGGWPAGDNATKQTMQRSASGWLTADATPRQANASTPVNEPTPTPTPTLTSTPQPTPTLPTPPSNTPNGGVGTPTPAGTDVGAQPTLTPQFTPTPLPRVSQPVSTPSPEPSKNVKPIIIAEVSGGSLNISSPKQPTPTKTTQAKPFAAAPSQKNLARVAESVSEPPITENTNDKAIANVGINQNPYFWLAGSILVGLALGVLAVFMTRRNQTDL